MAKTEAKDLLLDSRTTVQQSRPPREFDNYNRAVGRLEANPIVKAVWLGRLGVLVREIR